MLANDPNVVLDGTIKLLERAKMILVEPDTDGSKDLMVAPVIKAAIDRLIEFYAPYKPKRGSK